MAGGNVIRLLGSGFTSNTSLWIWANQAGASRLVSTNELDVIVPASTVAGSVDVVATSPTNSYRVSNGYNYTKTATSLLTQSSASLQFGSVSVGKTSTQVLTLKSSGSAPVVISSVGMAGSGYSIIGGTLVGVAYPVTLNPTATATLTIQFHPAAAGAANGKSAIYSNSSSGRALSTSLAGTGVAAGTTPHLTIAPANSNFGSVSVGKSATQPSR
jgi:Abnormal spindle-like microcephaly-assoc'd, ASPM-SPD-2-Hydin